MGFQLKNIFLIPPNPLTNFEIQKYYQNESRFNGVYSRDTLSNKIKDGAYGINLDEHFDIGTHWIALYNSLELHSNNNVSCFYSFGVEHIPKEKKVIKGTIDSKNRKPNIFRIQVYDSVMCGYFCIGSIHFILKEKIITDFTNLLYQMI